MHNSLFMNYEKGWLLHLSEAAEEEDPKESARQWQDAFVQQIVLRVGHGSREDFLAEVRLALGAMGEEGVSGEPTCKT